MAEVSRWIRPLRSTIARSRTEMGDGWAANVSSRLCMMYSWGVLVSIEEARKVIVSVAKSEHHHRWELYGG